MAYHVNVDKVKDIFVIHCNRLNEMFVLPCLDFVSALDGACCRQDVSAFAELNGGINRSDLKCTL